jgi:hypothetical protein
VIRDLFLLGVLLSILSHGVPTPRTYFSVLSCASTPEPQIRIIINDGVVPLHGIRTCPYDDKHGMCPLPAFIEAQQETIRETDWVWGCHGDWEVPEGSAWNSTTGDAPQA